MLLPNYNTNSKTAR